MFRLFSAARSTGTYAYGVLCLLVVMSALRACIPAGFMPDPGVLAQGRWALMLCPAAGGAPLWPSTTPTPGADEHATHDMAHVAMNAPVATIEHDGHQVQGATMDCPFSLITNLALHLPTPLLASVALAHVALATAPNAPASRPPLPAAGPPVGSRAPPRFQV